MKEEPYSDVGEGWVRPIRNEFRLRCCDCGLVHKFWFRLVKHVGYGKAIEFKVARDNKATGQFRRHRGVKIKSRKPTC